MNVIRHADGVRPERRGDSLQPPLLCMQKHGLSCFLQVSADPLLGDVLDMGVDAAQRHHLAGFLHSLDELGVGKASVVCLTMRDLHAKGVVVPFKGLFCLECLPHLC